MNAERYAMWQNELIERLKKTNLFVGNQMNIELLNSEKTNGITIANQEGRTLRIDETSYIKYFKNAGSRSFSWEDSINFATNQCEKYIKNWIDFYK